MTIGGEGTLNECQTRYTRVENGPTTACMGKTTGTRAPGEWNLPQRSAGVEMTTVWLISTNLNKYKKTRKSICKIGTAKKCLSTNVRYIRKKITSNGLKTGNILSYLSEDTLLTFFIFIGRKQDWKLNFSRFCESQILSKFFLMGMIIPSSIAELQNYICNFKSLDRKRNV